MTSTSGSKCRCDCFSILFATSKSPIVPSLMHMVLMFSRCVWSKNDGWDTDAKHVRFALFASICFHAISKRYLEQTSSHLIGKLKSFVKARMSFNKHVKIRSSGPASSSLLDTISQVESSALTHRSWLLWSLFSMSTTLATISGHTQWVTSF